MTRLQISRVIDTRVISCETQQKFSISDFKEFYLKLPLYFLDISPSRLECKILCSLFKISALQLESIHLVFNSILIFLWPPKFYDLSGFSSFVKNYIMGTQEDGIWFNVQNFGKICKTLNSCDHSSRPKWEFTI